MAVASFPAGGRFTIDGVDAGATWNMFIRNPQHQHQPTMRSTPQDIPGRVGRYPGLMELSSRLLSLDIGCYDTDGHAAVMQHIIDFAAATDPRNGIHKLVLTDDFPGWWIGLTPSTQGSGQTDITLSQVGPGYATFTAQFEAVDPHWYKITSQSLAWAIPSGSLPAASRQKIVNNAGNDSTPPKYTITYTGATNRGSLTGMKIAYSSQYFSSSVTYNGIGAPGDVFVINTDPDNLIITKNGVNDIVNWGGDDFPFLPGTTTGLPPFSPPLASPVPTTLTWSDTNNIGATVQIDYTERSV